MFDGLERARIPDNFFDIIDSLLHRVDELERLVVTLAEGDARWRGGGITSGRPTYPQSHVMFFDTTIGQPIWWSGSGWVDADGVSV